MRVQVETTGTSASTHDRLQKLSQFAAYSHKELLQIWGLEVACRSMFNPHIVELWQQDLYGTYAPLKTLLVRGGCAGHSFMRPQTKRCLWAPPCDIASWWPCPIPPSSLGSQQTLRTGCWILAKSKNSAVPSLSPWELAPRRCVTAGSGGEGREPPCSGGRGSGNEWWWHLWKGSAPLTQTIWR